MSLFYKESARHIIRFSRRIFPEIACWIGIELNPTCGEEKLIALMHHLKFIHPPGGATALTAVIGGAAVHRLGFHFVLFPVLINAVIMVLIVVLFKESGSVPE